MEVAVELISANGEFLLRNETEGSIT